MFPLIAGAKFVRSSTHRTQGSCSRAVRMHRWVCGMWTYRGRRRQSGGRATPVRSVASPFSGTSRKCGPRKPSEFDRYTVFHCSSALSIRICTMLCIVKVCPLSFTHTHSLSLCVSLPLSFPPPSLSPSHTHTHTCMHTHYLSPLSITVESVVELCVPSAQTKSPPILQWDMKFLFECVPTATQRSLQTSEY